MFRLILLIFLRCRVQISPPENSLPAVTVPSQFFCHEEKQTGVLFLIWDIWSRCWLAPNLWTGHSVKVKGFSVNTDTDTPTPPRVSSPRWETRTVSLVAEACLWIVSRNAEQTVESNKRVLTDCKEESSGGEEDGERVGGGGGRRGERWGRQQVET